MWSRTTDKKLPEKTRRSAPAWWLEAFGVLLSLLAVWAACWFAPTEASMGHAQRVLYVHVAVAWFALVAFVVAALTSLGYLLSYELKWDYWTQSLSEVGWLCCSLTLLTGSLWAHEAWGTWWTWDPRLTAAFVLWLLYSGSLVARLALEQPEQQALVASAMAVLGALDVPLVVLATRWFRGIHPPAPQMEPAMRVALLVSLVGFNALFLLLTVRRHSQLKLTAELKQLELATEDLFVLQNQQPDDLPFETRT